MNYFNLTARGLLILYCMFLLLFAFGENVGSKGFIHAVSAVVILTVLVLLKGKPVANFFVFLIAFALSVWFFNTNKNFFLFSVVSLPLAMASALFLIGKYYPVAGKKVKSKKTTI